MTEGMVSEFLAILHLVKTGNMNAVDEIMKLTLVFHSSLTGSNKHLENLCKHFTLGN